MKRVMMSIADQIELLIEAVIHGRDEVDRELDAMIFYFTTPEFQQKGPMNIWLQTNASKSALVPLYTSSSDAALGLLNRVLPDWAHGHRTQGFGKDREYKFVVISPPTKDSHTIEFFGPTFARACVGAVLSAKLAYEAGLRANPAAHPADRDDNDLLQY